VLPSFGPGTTTSIMTGFRGQGMIAYCDHSAIMHAIDFENVTSALFRAAPTGRK
jgi:hypothetical protein